MSSQPKPVSCPWRRYLRFSVRGLVVVVLLIGGWLGWIVRCAQIQRQTVALIKRHNSKVWYDLERDGTEPWAPRWFVDRIGYDYFATVIFVSIAEAAPIADLVYVPRFSRLEELDRVARR